MCLYLSVFAFRRKAKQDIPVFKVLVMPADGRNSFTPYQRTGMQLGSEYTSQLKREGFEVNYGLHTYEDFIDARNLASSLQRGLFRSRHYNEGLNVIVVDAIIPQGSYYYVGDHEGRGTSYASTNLRLSNDYVSFH